MTKVTIYNKLLIIYNTFAIKMDDFIAGEILIMGFINRRISTNKAASIISYISGFFKISKTVGSV